MQAYRRITRFATTFPYRATATSSPSASSGLLRRRTPSTSARLSSSPTTASSGRSAGSISRAFLRRTPSACPSRSRTTGRRSPWERPVHPATSASTTGMTPPPLGHNTVQTSSKVLECGLPCLWVAFAANGLVTMSKLRRAATLLSSALQTTTVTRRKVPIVAVAEARRCTSARLRDGPRRARVSRWSWERTSATSWRSTRTPRWSPSPTNTSLRRRAK